MKDTFQAEVNGKSRVMIRTSLGIRMYEKVSSTEETISDIETLDQEMIMLGYERC
jgi:hypothetical protein